MRPTGEIIANDTSSLIFDGAYLTMNSYILYAKEKLSQAFHLEGLSLDDFG